MYYTNNPIADAERYEADRERELKKYPVCCNCGEHIQDDYCYVIQGDIYCSDCLNDDFRVCVEQLIDD